MSMKKYIFFCLNPTFYTNKYKWLNSIRGVTFHSPAWIGDLNFDLGEYQIGSWRLTFLYESDLFWNSRVSGRDIIRSFFSLLRYSTAHAKSTKSAAMPRTDCFVFEVSPHPQRVFTRHAAGALGDNSRSDAASVSASASIRLITPSLIRGDSPKRTIYKSCMNIITNVK